MSATVPSFLDKPHHRDYLLVNLVKELTTMEFVSLYDAKTRLSALVDRASAGEEIVIAKNGIACARLVPIEQRGERRTPANAMCIETVAADFDAPDPHVEHLFNA